MPFENKPVREITEADLREIIGAGLEEHLFLDYKAEPYAGNDDGRKEFLQDVCMFANAQGGLLLIGITERRDDQGQPTGIPDPEQRLGVVVGNPEALLQSYDASVAASIEERLPLEAAPVAVADGRTVLAIRVPNSTAKPHCVRFKGHVYFPSRRERHRIHLSVREIKDLAMRTASQLERGERLLRESLRGINRSTDLPYLFIGMVPMFFTDFLVDISRRQIVDSVARFDMNEMGEIENPQYTFNGLRRTQATRDTVITLGNNGLVTMKRQLATRDARGRDSFYVTAIDILLRGFVMRARTVYLASALAGPFLLTAELITTKELLGIYGDFMFEQTMSLPAGHYPFPILQVGDLNQVDRTIKPLCDHAHQAFGQPSSPCFDVDGNWRDPRVRR